MKMSNESIIKLLIQERDEARRLACSFLSELVGDDKVLSSPEDIAAEYGWDCFEGEENA
jgi:hypothetical protein